MPGLGRIAGMIPGAGLMQQAWDATKLAGEIIRKNKERAVVLADERRNEIAQYRGKRANEKVKELFEQEKYDEIAALYLPMPVVTKAKSFIDFWWKTWDVYFIFALIR